MVGPTTDIFRIAPLAAVDRDFLSRVQTGFAAWGGGGLTWDELLVIILVFVAAVLVILLLRQWFRPQKIRLAAGEMDEITDAGNILQIVEKSVELRAVYDIEVYDRNYQEIYKCPVMRINRDGFIEAGLSSFTDLTLDFRDKNVGVSFRMSRRGKQEFYHFETICRDLVYTDFRGLREKALLLSMPGRVTVAQKRRFLRVQPEGEYVFNVDLVALSRPENPAPLGAFRLLHRTRILDLSIGGLQVVLMAPLKGPGLELKQQLYLRLRLPLRELNVERLPDQMIIQAKIVGLERQEPETPPVASSPGEVPLWPYHVRFMFTGRGRIDEAKQTVLIQDAREISFEDVARWIQAYQRLLIQEDKGTKPEPVETFDLFRRRSPLHPPGEAGE